MTVLTGGNRFSHLPYWKYGEKEGARRGYNPKKHDRASQNPIIASIGTGYNVNIWNRSGLYTKVQCVSIRPKSSGKQLRLFKDEEDTKEYRYSVLVTNDDKHRPEELWEIYRGRSLEENRELKEGYGWDTFNVKSFWGTEAAMILIGMVSLIHFLNRKVFSKKGEVMHRLKMLRLKIFAIPAIYVKASGIEILRLGVIDKRLRGKICYLMQKIQGLNLILGNCNAFG